MSVSSDRWTCPDCHETVRVDDLSRTEAAGHLRRAQRRHGRQHDRERAAEQLEAAEPAEAQPVAS